MMLVQKEVSVMMKFARNLGLGSLFALLVFTGYAMGGYGMNGYPSGGGSMAGTQTVATSSERLVSPSSAFIGRLAGVNVGRRQILLDTFVPGLMGPSERIVPFNISNDTTISLCFKSTGTCESGLIGRAGLASVGMVDEQLPSVAKNTVVVGDPAIQGRVVHVQITYED